MIRKVNAKFQKTCPPSILVSAECAIPFTVDNALLAYRLRLPDNWHLNYKVRQNLPDQPTEVTNVLAINDDNFLKLIDKFFEEGSGKVSITAIINLSLPMIGNVNGNAVLNITKDEWLEARQSDEELESALYPCPSWDNLSLLESIENLTSSIKSDEYQKMLAFVRDGIRGIEGNIREEISQKYRKFEPLAELLNSLNQLLPEADANWILATIALSSLEPLVNLKLTELNKDTAGKFGERTSRLVKGVTQVEGRDIRGLETELNGRYEERSNIIHGIHKTRVTKEMAEGYKNFVERLIQTLWPYRV